MGFVMTQEMNDDLYAEVFRVQKAGTRRVEYVSGQRYKLVSGDLRDGMVAIVQAVELYWAGDDVGNRWRKKAGHKPRTYTVVSFDAEKRLLVGKPLDRW